ncbi:helix-turn-helix transcriptional regulator [Proteiniclasticum sp. SCR006]|uniref:Helix-turn-helix transcriptional regulator n=1 Tax=Proteiniclasticum aestuarii TaxID=2817862 RepID=A0A939HAG4_9CLOT|nr:helix-turn-helix transcriptional regulator [Proteiniclasticum aestuarii]
MKENLKKFRKQRGLTQRELAELTGVSTGYIQMIELGKKNNPSIDLIQKLADALYVQVNELLGENVDVINGHPWLDSSKLPIVTGETIDIHSGVIEPAYSFFKLIFNHYGFDKTLKKTALDVFYSDDEVTKYLFVSMINSVLGSIVQYSSKLESNNNKPITEEFQVKWFEGGDGGSSSIEKYYKLGHPSRNFEYLKYKAWSTIRTIKYEHPSVNIDQSDLDELIEKIKNMTKREKEIK